MEEINDIGKFRRWFRKMLDFFYINSTIKLLVFFLILERGIIVTDEEIMLVVRERTRIKSIELRCYSKNNPRYHQYGGRGIKVCKEWRGTKGFLNYFNYVSKLPHFNEPGYSLDRIDNDGDYEPGNVQWATARTQAINRRCTLRDDDGTPIIEICEKYNLSYTTVIARYNRGDRGDRLRRPLNTYKKRKSASPKNGNTPLVWNEF